MIDGSIVKFLAKRVPNYHVLDAEFARKSETIPLCAKCQFCTKGRTQGRPVRGDDGAVEAVIDRAQHVCLRVRDAYGAHAVVAANGTCDAGKLRHDEHDYSNFQLESATIEENRK